ncbi:hypothetical protein M3J09_001057 [Ascochyta lentis]
MLVTGLNTAQTAIESFVELVVYDTAFQRAQYTLQVKSVARFLTGSARTMVVTHWYATASRRWERTPPSVRPHAVSFGTCQGNGDNAVHTCGDRRPKRTDLMAHQVVTRKTPTMFWTGIDVDDITFKKEGGKIVV